MVTTKTFMYVMQDKRPPKKKRRLYNAVDLMEKAAARKAEAHRSVSEHGCLLRP